MQLCGFSQPVTISGDIKDYYLKVDEVYADGVRVTGSPGQLANFAPGDRVLIIQMTGVTIDDSGDFLINGTRTKKAVGNTGKFEILQVDEVNTLGADTIIYFTDNLTNGYDNPEKIQLVKVIEGETVTVTGTLTSRAWDGNTGGIIAIIGIDTIKLASGSVIDVSGKGFRGAQAPEEIYPDGLCRNGVDGKDTLYFKPDQLYRSGNKGEGIITAQWPYSKGTGFNINGGGGGNGLFSGGGGGSNYLAGGDGGQQSTFCSGNTSVKGGWGGYGCKEFYENPELPKVLFGGGGGSGNTKSGSPSDGGSGGGLIILITETMVAGNNVIVRANGTSAYPDISTGSGAGGGAGGTILIDATQYSGSPFKVEIKGGNGSATRSESSYFNGAGGGGSGGVFWHSGLTLPQVTIDSSNGRGGLVLPEGSSHPAQLGLPGSQGVSRKGLIVPLTGFLFNSIRGVDTICESQVPNVLTASKPKGGDGEYSFKWQQSTDKINWSDANGVEELRSFAPAALNQTTYFRRIVSSRNPVTFEQINDTSRIVEIFVYPAIDNNLISGIDTICFNSDAKILTGAPVTGGNGIFSYTWQSSADLNEWNDEINTPDFDPSRLTVSTSFRRIVNSTAYCSDTSSSVEIAVLPPIDNNDFVDTDSVICKNTSPGRILISPPGGGDGKYTYTWQKTTTSLWSDIPLTTDSVFYTEGILEEATSYRRIVYSGFKNACIDTSNARTISLRPPVSHNFIEGSEIKYTCYNTPVNLSGSEPLDGFGPGTFAYSWEESDDKNNWTETSATGRDFQSQNLTSTRYFRRKVYSTPQYHECLDISSPIEVRINPLPTGNVQDMGDTICEGETLYVKFNISGNGPFNASLRGDSETVKSKTGITGPIDSIAFNPQIAQNFVMVSIEDDSGCFADVATFVPLSPAKVFKIPQANAGPDKEACGNVTELSASKTNSGYKGIWTSPYAVFSDSTLERTIATVSSYGTHTFKWTETNWRCSDDDEVEITFFEPPALPDAGSDQELDFLFITQLHASEPSPGTGSWSVQSGSGQFEDINDPHTMVSEVSEQTVLVWTVVNGVCPAATDSMKIKVKMLENTKAFTPNGDGKNDEFELNVPNAEKITIRVFNRAGQLVYKSDNYCGSKESGLNCDFWSGLNMNNVELPEGTYFYIIRMKVAGKEKEFEFKSFVEIMR